VTRNPGEARAIQMRTVFAGIEMAVGDFEDPQSISGIVKDASRCLLLSCPSFARAAP
jgi:uncharacterized protein YbjT (DUF2867 family)